MLCFGFFIGVKYCSLLSAKVQLSCVFGVFKLFVRVAPCVGIRTFIIVAIAGHGNLQYYHTEFLVLYYFAVVLEPEHLSCYIRITAFTIVTVGLQYCHMEIL